MEYNERMGAIECILFVSGDPVPIIELQRAIEKNVQAAVAEKMRRAAWTSFISGKSAAYSFL